MPAKKRITHHIIKHSTNHTLSLRLRALAIAIVIISFTAISVNGYLYGTGPLADFFARTTGIKYLNVQIESPEELAALQKPEISAVGTSVKRAKVISDDPTANAIAAAKEAKDNHLKVNPTDTAGAQKVAETAAKAAAKKTVQNNAAVAVAPTTQNRNKAQNNEDVETVADYVKNVDTVVNNAVAVAKAVVNVGNVIDPSKPKCKAKNGTDINSGETVIGAGDDIYTCSDNGKGIANFVVLKCDANNVPLSDQNQEGAACSSTKANGVDLVTVKPTYMAKDKRNCFSDGTAFKTDDINDSKKCHNGAWVEVDAQTVAASYNGNSPEEVKKREDACKKFGGSWDDNNKICGQGVGNTPHITTKEECEKSKSANQVCQPTTVGDKTSYYPIAAIKTGTTTPTTTTPGWGDASTAVKDLAAKQAACRKVGDTYNTSTGNCEATNVVTGSNSPANPIINPNGKVDGSIVDHPSDCQTGEDNASVSSDGMGPTRYKCGGVSASETSPTGANVDPNDPNFSDAGSTVQLPDAQSPSSVSTDRPKKGCKKSVADWIGYVVTFTIIDTRTDCGISEPPTSQAGANVDPNEVNFSDAGSTVQLPDSTNTSWWTDFVNYITGKSTPSGYGISQ